ncbi:hypothetical protein [Nocardia sp. NPDC058705]|uniref:hypothetical protein n=1 Tax=Nocardia sp. NPDC058705 TaxID=3346609 RepID=UPI0036B24A95
MAETVGDQHQVLTDNQWELLELLLPKSDGRVGRNFSNNRRCLREWSGMPANRLRGATIVEPTRPPASTTEQGPCCMTDHSITFSFSDSDASEADALAGDLTESLRDQLPEVSVTRTRSNKQNQDFGATIVAIVGAPFMVTLAGGIATWMARRSDAKLHMRRIGLDGKEIEVTVNGRLGARQTGQLINEFFAD